MASTTPSAPAEGTASAPAEATPAPADTLAKVLSASGSTPEMGTYGGTPEQATALETEASEMGKAATALGKLEGKRLPLVKLLTEGLMRFAASVIREGTTGDKSIGPDWSRESGLCKSFYALTVTAPLVAAKVSEEAQATIGMAIRDQIRNTYREQYIRAWVKDQAPEGTSDEKLNAEVTRQYERFGLKVPGTARAPKTTAGPKGNLENPGATLETAVAAVAASEVTVAPAVILTQILSLYSGLVTRYVEGKGSLEGWADAVPLLDKLNGGVSALHKRQVTGEGDFAALLTPLQ